MPCVRRYALRNGDNEPDKQRQHKCDRSRNWLEAHVESPNLRIEVLGNRISDNVCLILAGRGHLKRIWVWLFLCFSFGCLGSAYFFVAIFFRRRFLKVIAFCPLPNPLPRGEGIMALKSTIIGFPVICPLSPWERVRERAKPQI